MKKLNKYLVAIVIIPLSLLSVSTFAARSGEHKMERGIYKQLNLTDAQAKSIKIIMLEKQIEIAKLDSGDRKANMQERQSLLKAVSFDEKMAKAMILKHQVLNVERKLIMLKAEHKAYQSLTAKQQQKYDSLMSKKSHHKGKNKNGKGSGEKGKKQGKGMKVQ